MFGIACYSPKAVPIAVVIAGEELAPLVVGVLENLKRLIDGPEEVVGVFREKSTCNERGGRVQEDVRQQ